MNINKNNFSFQEIKAIFTEKGDRVGDTIYGLLKCFNLVSLCHKTGFVKMKGYSVNEILTIFFLFPFMLISTIRGFITCRYQISPVQKDTFYRFLNNENLNW